MIPTRDWWNSHELDHGIALEHTRGSIMQPSISRWLPSRKLRAKRRHRRGALIRMVRADFKKLGWKIPRLITKWKRRQYNSKFLSLASSVIGWNYSPRPLER